VVGRISLREAVGALSLIGILNVRPGHGTHVSPSTGESSSKPLRWGMFVSWHEKLHEFIEARIALDQALVGMATDLAASVRIAGMGLGHSPRTMGSASRASGMTITRASGRFFSSASTAAWSVSAALLRRLDHRKKKVRCQV